jgi:hypothetical protein
MDARRIRDEFRPVRSRELSLRRAAAAVSSAAEGSR